AAGGAPRWVKLVRSGSTIAASQSVDGVTWTLVGSDTVSLPSTVYVGLAVCSQSFGVLTTATFDSVSVMANSGDQAPAATLTGPADGVTYTAPASVPLTATASDPDGGDTIDHVTFFANGSAVGTVTTPVAGVYSFNWGSVAAGNYTLTATATDNHGLTGAMSNAAHITVNSASSTLPTPWAAQDIGSGGAVGSASALNGAFTVRGAGDDIWGTADAFQFVYQ